MGIGKQVGQHSLPFSYDYNLGLYFERIASIYSKNDALVYPDGKRYTYSCLQKSVEVKANYLSAQNIQYGSVVAIFNDKSFDAISLMFACLKLGIIYANLDVNSPPERLRKILLTASASLIAGNTLALSTHKESIKELGISFHDYSLPYSSQQSAIPNNIQKPLEQPVGTSIAYIMFTSGSTGFPKAVSISHASLINFIAWSKATFAITPSDRLTSLNPFHFDNSVFDIFSSLFSGSSLLLIPETWLKNPIQVIRMVDDENCTIWFSVPSFIVYCLALKSISVGSLSSLRFMLFGGEAFPKSPLRKLNSLLAHSTQLVNVYGPTECTCICSAYFVSSEDLMSDHLLPLGLIAPNFKWMICSQDGKLVKPGECGELLLGGPNLSNGYYNDIKKTEKSFIQNPLNQATHETFYRTGDLVTQDPSTSYLHFSGRADNQIKRMGFRIELEEIEAAIGSLPQVNENAVVAISEPMHPAASVIIACVVSPLDSKGILSALRDKLPSYMIPDKISYFEALPKNQNGKIDRVNLKSIFTT